MWFVFTQIFGRGFLTEFGELPNDIWIEELAKFSPHDIEFGIEQCKRSGSNFAPRLPQFLAYCIPIVEDVYAKIESDHHWCQERRERRNLLKSNTELGIASSNARISEREKQKAMGLR